MFGCNIVTSRKQLFKRLHSVNDWIKDIGVRFIFLVINTIFYHSRYFVEQSLFLFIRFFIINKTAKEVS
jgi:hypothetical protein